MEIVSNIALISINATLWVQLISFLIFLFIINRVMFKPLNKTMDDRESHLQKMASEIKRVNHQYEAVLEELKAQEIAVKSAARKLSREHEAEGAKEAETILDSARGEIAALKAKAETQIGRQMAEAQQTILAESETLALAMMEKILDRRLTS